MKVKDLLSKYDGEFRIYRDIMEDEDVLVADHNTPERELKKIGRKRIYRFFSVDFGLEIYLK